MRDSPLRRRGGRVGKLFTLATLVLNVLATKRVEIVFSLNAEDPEKKIHAFRRSWSRPRPGRVSPLNPGSTEAFPAPQLLPVAHGEQRLIGAFPPR